MSTQESKEPKGEIEETQVEESPQVAAAEGEAEESPAEDEDFASAKNLPRPATVLPIPGVGDIQGVVTALVGDIPGPTLEEIRQVNQETGGDTRTPLMTVIQAIIRDRGGSMRLTELCSAVTEHWNRPYPTSPYAPDEFIYVMVRNSDSIRITH